MGKWRVFPNKISTPMPRLTPTSLPTPTPTPSFCEGKQGLFVAPPCASGNDDCRGYYNCLKGTESMTLCPTDTRFSSERMFCDWKGIVECSAVCQPTSAPASLDSMGLGR